MKNSNVGVIVNTHGLKGEVKVKLLSDFPALRFAKGAHVYYKGEDEEKELIVCSSRAQKDMLIVSFQDMADINLIEPLKGTLLYIHEDQLQPLEEDEAYFHELMDSEVYDQQDDYLGKVVELIETGTNVVLRVKSDECEHLIPFVKAFVVSFDKTHKRMCVNLLEGL